MNDGAGTNTEKALRDSYLATDVFVRLGDDWVDASDAARRLGVTLFVLTAYNPASVSLDHAVNERRNAALGDELSSAGLTAYPAIGRSPDGTWTEPGFALPGIDLAKAAGLGREHGQNAVFEILPGCLVVHACDLTWRLERPAGGSDVT